MLISGPKTTLKDHQDDSPEHAGGGGAALISPSAIIFHLMESLVNKKRMCVFPPGASKILHFYLQIRSAQSATLHCGGVHS